MFVKEKRIYIFRDRRLNLRRRVQSKLIRFLSTAVGKLWRHLSPQQLQR